MSLHIEEIQDISIVISNKRFSRADNIDAINVKHKKPFRTKLDGMEMVRLNGIQNKLLQVFNYACKTFNLAFVEPRVYDILQPIRASRAHTHTHVLCIFKI